MRHTVKWEFLIYLHLCIGTLSGSMQSENSFILWNVDFTEQFTAKYIEVSNTHNIFLSLFSANLAGSALITPAHPKNTSLDFSSWKKYVH